MYWLTPRKRPEARKGRKLSPFPKPSPETALNPRQKKNNPIKKKKTYGISEHKTGIMLR
jgi:hypothetical protein